MDMYVLVMQLKPLFSSYNSLSLSIPLCHINERGEGSGGRAALEREVYYSLMRSLPNEQ